MPSSSQAFGAGLCALLHRELGCLQRFPHLQKGGIESRHWQPLDDRHRPSPTWRSRSCSSLRHQYRTNLGNLVTAWKEILEGQKGDPLLVPRSEGPRWSFEFMTTSWHAQLALKPGPAWVADHYRGASPVWRCLLSLTSGSITQLSCPLFTHHMLDWWLQSSFGAGAHAAIALIPRFDPAKHVDNVLDRCSQGSRCPDQPPQTGCAIFLGFHSSALYIHKRHHALLWAVPRTCFSDSAIQLQLFSAQWIQGLHAPLPHTALTRFSGSARCSTEPVVACWGKVAAGPIPRERHFMRPPHTTPSRSTSPC